MLIPVLFVRDMPEAITEAQLFFFSSFLSSRRNEP